MNIKTKEINTKSIIFLSLVSIIAVIALLLFRQVIVFGVFLIFSAVLNYYQNKFQLQFDLTPSLVLLIIFSIKLGFFYGLIFLILGSFIPSAVGGGFNHMTIIFVGLAVLISYLGSIGITSNMMLYGIGLILVQAISAFAIGVLFSGDPGIIFSVFIGLFLNIIYFLVFSQIISLLL